MRKIGLAVHEFNSANASWLDYVIKNRRCAKCEIYDVVIGPTADSNAQEIIEDYCDKILSSYDKNKVIGMLKPSVYGTQMCFKTQRAIDYINSRFVERREIK